ncbi:hypothetical protein diail_5422 [Diaporthe ilicicola]|nr:hypothetical protein diail_5422 [Diaporthe ilicicola]
MKYRISLLPLLAILASTPLGFCQKRQDIFGSGAEGLFGIPTSEYSDPKKANGTGSITFDRYTLSVAVSADVPIPDKDDVAMTSVLSLEVDPSGGNLTTCVAIYSGLSANVTAAAADLKDSQDGYGCGQMLSDECISDLYSAASQGLSGDCGNFLPQIPQSCTSQFADLSGTGGGIGNESEQIIYQYGTVPASKGNDTAWLAAATNIWPVLTTAIGGNGSTLTSETFLNCIRPDTFSEGTVRPPSSSDSGDGDSDGTPTTGGTTPSPTNVASRPGLLIAAIVGLGFNAAMFFM